MLSLKKIFFEIAFISFLSCNKKINLTNTESSGGGLTFSDLEMRLSMPVIFLFTEQESIAISKKFINTEAYSLKLGYWEAGLKLNNNQ